MIPAAPTGAVASVGHPLLLAADAAFYAVFGVFVLAFVVLTVVTVRWAVRRDRVGRAEWVQRKQEADRPQEAGAQPEGAPGGRRPVRGQANGHVPRRNDQHGGTPRRPS